jgi:hypothetical protein
MCFPRESCFRFADGALSRRREKRTDANLCRVSFYLFPDRRFRISAGEFVAECVLIRATVGKRAKIDSRVALMQFARGEDVRDSGVGDSLYFSFSEYYSVT